MHRLAAFLSNLIYYLAPVQERHVRGAVGADIRDERALSGSETFKIPFKDIVQARQEKNLVDLLLRRYERKEKGDYLSEDAEDCKSLLFPLLSQPSLL